MLGFLPSSVLGVFTLTLAIINTIIHASLMSLTLPFKWIGPAAIADRMTRLSLRLTENWCSINGWILNTLLPPIDWQVDLPPLDKQQNYFLVSNHQTWVDIILLFTVFNGRIPLIRFFTKREIAWIPFLGFALLAMDFPLMKRYSKQVLAKYPHLRGKDIETTRRSCAKIARHPYSILNFLEGTRITPFKHQHQQSPYHYLLKPKTTGIAFAFAALGPQMNQLIDVTLHYPEGVPSFIDLWSGRMRKVVISAQLRPIPVAYTCGDYENDPVFRDEFQDWVRQIWQEKDHLLASMHQR